MSAEEIAESYASIADRVDRWERLDRAFTGRYRQQFEDAHGRVLDVACGTGTNFRYLPAAVDLVGIDISPDMLAKAVETLHQIDRDAELYQMDAQALAFPDDHFDTVISSFSTCTFPDPIAALREMGRVCKPGGQILLVEHGRVDIEPLARFQDWRADAHYQKVGCRWNQEPLELVQKAGLTVDETSTSLFGLITSVQASTR